MTITLEELNLAVTNGNMDAVWELVFHFGPQFGQELVFLATDQRCLEMCEALIGKEVVVFAKDQMIFE